MLVLLRIDPSGSSVTPLALCNATDLLNSRFRQHGLSAKEIVFGRDQFTGIKLEVSSDQIALKQHQLRLQNHAASAYSKASVKRKASEASVHVGDLVFIKSEGSKHNPRHRYIISNISGGIASLQKMNAAKMSSQKYEVPLTQLFPAIANQSNRFIYRHPSSDDTSEDEEVTEVHHDSAVHDTSDMESNHTSSDPDVSQSSSDDGTSGIDNPPMQRPVRHAREPAWLRGNEWER